MSFRISALAKEPFAELFTLDDEQLAKRLAKRVVVDAKPGFPCRVSLRDAEIGETVILVNHEHLPARSPFRSAHAIFVSEHSRQAQLQANELPPYLQGRPIAVRGFDNDDMMIEADIAETDLLPNTIERFFANPKIEFIQLHFAKQGCFAAKVMRA